MCLCQSISDNDICRKLKGCCKKGLKAISEANKNRIQFQNTRLIKCSIDLDQCAQIPGTQQARWDYLVEYDKKLVFIEVHPLQTNAQSVISKKSSISNWLKDEQCGLKSYIKQNNLQIIFCAFSTNGVNRTVKNILAQNGIPVNPPTI